MDAIGDVVTAMTRDEIERELAQIECDLLLIERAIERRCEAQFEARWRLRKHEQRQRGGAGLIYKVNFNARR